MFMAELHYDILPIRTKTDTFTDMQDPIHDPITMRK